MKLNQHDIHGYANNAERSTRRLIDSGKVVRVEGELVSKDFLDDCWFNQLAVAIYREIKRLKTCRMRELTQGKFKNTNGHHFIEALNSLGDLIIQTWKGSLTEYSINKNVKIIEHPKFKDFCLPPKNPNQAVKPTQMSLYGQEYQ